MQDSLSGQTASLFKTDDLPSGAVPPGTAPVVAVAAAPQHPSNAVLIHMRPEGGPATLLRAVPEGSPSQLAQQWYKATLPALGDGHSVDYRVELIRAGQCLATLPTDGSWLTVIADREAAVVSNVPNVSNVSDVSEKRSSVHFADKTSSATPRWAYNLTFFATLTAQLRPEVIGETPEGHRINFFIQGGRVIGPRIDAILRPEGGDWMCIRRDGIGMVDIRITYETSDGALILDRAGGVFDLGPDGYAKVLAGQFAGTTSFYATPTFMTAHPDWKWLNRCQGFGIGRVIMEDLRVECDIYIPQVLERLNDG